MLRTAEHGAVPDSLCRLPAFRPVVVQVIRALRREEVEVQEVEKLIQSDPGLGAEILALANSPLFGFTSEIGSVRHAITVLGFNRVKSVLMMIALRAYLNRTGHGPEIQALWRHSLACATIAHYAASTWRLEPDRAYTDGLMHDIGRVGLLSAYPDRYAELFKAEHANVDAIRSAERRAFEFDHCTAGMWLTKVWGFPQEYLDVCACHHDPPADANSLVSVIALSCKLADALGCAAIPFREAPDVEELRTALGCSLPDEFADVQKAVAVTLAAVTLV